METTNTTSTTATRTSITSAAASSLLNSLEVGSGVDSASLVSSLVEAQFASKNAQLTAKYDKLTSQISGVSTLKSTITDFSKALENLVKGGALASQPVSSNTGVLSASALSGATLSGLTASVSVSQLAAAQTAVSRTAVASSNTVIGTGTLTLKLGTASYDADGAMTGLTGTDADGDGAADSIAIDITDGNSSLSGIAAAINAKRAGVTASVVTDADGTAYLSLKGVTGAAQAFTLEATTTTSGDLASLNVGPGATGTVLTSQARNARLTVDGVSVERASNAVSDLIDGVKLDLTGVSTVPVTLTASTPTTALSAAVNDFVETYNQVFKVVQEQTDAINGALRGDTGAKNLLRSLQGLTLKTLVPGAGAGVPSTLAGLGIGTNRDGTLSINADTLAAALKDNPQAVEAMFAATTDGTGLYGAMNSLQLSATSTLYGLGASNTRYLEQQSDVTKQQDKIADQASSASTRLTSQFTSMNAKVAAYKSTQAFLKQQIDAWTNSNN